MSEVILYSNQSMYQKKYKNYKEFLKSIFLIQVPIVKKFKRGFARNFNENYTRTFNGASSTSHATCYVLIVKENVLWAV
jgi:dTDP-4-amino-4,6-dideoxygalactose transaminase